MDEAQAILEAVGGAARAIGFLLFLPFVIIDMVVASVLMSMGMMMLPPIMISLRFKLIFFVLVDGWYLVAGSQCKASADDSRHQRGRHWFGPCSCFRTANEGALEPWSPGNRGRALALTARAVSDQIESILLAIRGGSPRGRRRSAMRCHRASHLTKWLPADRQPASYQVGCGRL